MYDQYVSKTLKTIMEERMITKQISVGTKVIEVHAIGHERSYEDRDVFISIYELKNIRDSISFNVRGEEILELVSVIQDMLVNSNKKSYFKRTEKDICDGSTGIRIERMAKHSRGVICITFIKYQKVLGTDKQISNSQFIYFNKYQLLSLCSLLTQASRQALLSNMYNHQKHRHWNALHEYIDKGLISKICVEESELNENYITDVSCDYNVPNFGSGFKIYNIGYHFKSKEAAERVYSNEIEAFRDILYLPIFKNEWDSLCKNITHNNSEVELIMPCTLEERYNTFKKWANTEGHEIMSYEEMVEQHLLKLKNKKLT